MDGQTRPLLKRENASIDLLANERQQKNNYEKKIWIVFGVFIIGVLLMMFIISLTQDIDCGYSHFSNERFEGDIKASKPTIKGYIVSSLNEKMGLTAYAGLLLRAPKNGNSVISSFGSSLELMNNTFYFNSKTTGKQTITSVPEASELYLIMEDNGNLVLYDQDKKPRWQTGTNGNPNAQLIMGMEVVFVYDYTKSPEKRVLSSAQKNLTQDVINYTEKMNSSISNVPKSTEISTKSNCRDIANFSNRVILSTYLMNPNDKKSVARLKLGNTELLLDRLGELSLITNGRKTWSVNRPNRKILGVHLIMQSDGNLVLYDQDNNPYWSSHTNGNPNAISILTADGDFVVYDKSKGEGMKAILWTARKIFGNDLFDFCLKRFEPIISINHPVNYLMSKKPFIRPGLFRSNRTKNTMIYNSENHLLTLTNTGALMILSKSGSLLWSAATDKRRDGASLVMQEDGNLVLYDKDKKPYWATNTTKTNAKGFALDAVGTLFLADESKVYWKSSKYDLVWY